MIGCLPTQVAREGFQHPGLTTLSVLRSHHVQGTALDATETIFGHLRSSRVQRAVDVHDPRACLR
jgi:hypothetical protein